MKNFVIIFFCIFVSCSLKLVNGVVCEFHLKASGTRRVEDCPDEEYCAAIYRSYYDNDYDFDVTEEGMGCGSYLTLIDDTLNATYCSTKGEGCFDETGDYGIPLNVCCCKGDMCNQDITTTTSATSSTPETSTTSIANGVICDKFMESSGTRRVIACPGEEYCSYVSSDMTDEDYYNGLEIETIYGGCGSFLDDILSIANATDYCIDKGEGCFEEVGDYEGAPVETACCCKGNMCNRKTTSSKNPVVVSFVTFLIVLLNMLN